MEEDTFVQCQKSFRVYFLHQKKIYMIVHSSLKMPDSRGNWLRNVVLKSSHSSKQMILIKQHKNSGSLPRKPISIKSLSTKRLKYYTKYHVMWIFASVLKLIMEDFLNKIDGYWFRMLVLIKSSNLMNEYQYILRNKSDAFFYIKIVLSYFLSYFSNIASISDIWLAFCFIFKAHFTYENI